MQKIFVHQRSRMSHGFTLVDDEVYERIKKYNWYVDPNGYVRTDTAGNPGSVYLHRVVLELYDRSIEVDHRDRDKLNNQKDNLRIANRSQNSKNKRIIASNTSGYKGVHFCKREMKYQARIWLGDKRKSLGYYFTPEEAAIVYNQAAVKYYGEFAVLNKVPEKFNNQKDPKE